MGLALERTIFIPIPFFRNGRWSPHALHWWPWALLSASQRSSSTLILDCEIIWSAPPPPGLSSRMYTFTYTGWYTDTFILFKTQSLRGLPFHNQGGVRVFTPEYNFFFCPNESTIFFFFQNESTIFFVLPIRPLFYYMTEREWYYGFASAASESAPAYDFWRKHNN